MFEMIGAGFASVFGLQTLLLIAAGVVLGIVFGSIPGLNTAMAVALCLPITYTLSAVDGIAMIMGLFIGGASGGLISAILLNIPGTAASIATTFDGHPMMRKGQAGKALGIGIVFSFIGGFLSMLALIFVAPVLSDLAIKFTPVEYFAVAFFSLTLMATLSGKSMVKGLISGFMGMAIAMVGMSPIDLTERYTFGRIELMSGFSMIAVLTGAFAISEVLKSAKESMGSGIQKEQISGFTIKGFGFSLKEFVSQIGNCIKSAVVGILIGILPGIGAGTANIVAYTTVKNTSKYPEKFGTGIIDGVVASETANNASVGGALIPLLTLGIPGDVASALLIGGLMIHGINPGPMLFVTNAPLVYTIFAALFVANICMLVLEYFGMRLFVKVLAVKKYALLPIIVILCSVGAFGSGNRVFDCICLMFFGIYGYFMWCLRYPLGPMIIGFILGPMAETNLRRAIMAVDGNVWAFFQRPIAVFFFLAAILSVVVTILQNRRGKDREKE
ncbi:MAG: Tat pathway signal protein [Lachnospiraceae bacterium]|nr:Tat pathway signal protein [Lachnospiraceae bacterium]